MAERAPNREEVRSDAPEQATPQGTPPRRASTPRLVDRWMLVAFVVSLAFGAGAAFWYNNYQSKWSRRAPKLDVRHEAAARRLSVPQNVSPSEEYPGPNGETLYLTQEQFKAANIVAALPGNAGKRLAGALAEKNPDRKAELLFALVNETPATPDGDKGALALYRMSVAALSAEPASAARDAAQAKLDRLIGCRFVGQRLPPCPDRPSESTLWALVAFAVVPFSAALVGLVLSFLSRRKARRAAAPAELHASSQEELGEGA